MGASGTAEKEIFLLAQLDPGCEEPERDDLYDTGVIATVLQLLKLPDGTVRVLVEGQRRAGLDNLREEGEMLVFAQQTGKEFSVPKKDVQSRRESDTLIPRVLPSCTMKHNLREILHVHDSDVTDSHFANANLVHCRFQNVNFCHSKFTEVDFSEVSIAHVNLTNASITDARIAIIDRFELSQSGAHLTGTAAVVPVNGTCLITPTTDPINLTIFAAPLYVLYELAISIPQAVLGDRITVPTANGEHQVDVPAGTQHGRVLKIAGMGVPHVRSGRRGDQLCIVHIAVPTHPPPRRHSLGCALKSCVRRGRKRL